MRCAILTDIHANREAFDAALSSAAALGAERWIFLGDMVGFGPDADYVLDKIETMVAQGALALRGNHDRHQPTDAATLNPAARRIVDWTVDRLNARQKLFLSERPLTLREGDVLFVHASAHEPQNWHEVETLADAARSFASTDARLVFCGHGHVPRLFSSAAQITQEDITAAKPLALDLDRRWLVGVGSVGMPRDGHAIAHFCLWDQAKGQLTFHECPYDARLTAQKIRAMRMPLGQHFGLLDLG